MTQLLAGGAALVLIAVLWGLGRRPGKTLLRSTDAATVAAINREQLGLVASDSSKVEPTSPSVPARSRSDETPFQSPRGAAERIALARQLLEALDYGDPAERLEAILKAGAWGHVCVLPLLRRGLRDADSLVVEAAAAAIAPHRGATRPSPAQLTRPPRNVARMR